MAQLLRKIDVRGCISIKYLAQSVCPFSIVSKCMFSLNEWTYNFCHNLDHLSEADTICLQTPFCKTGKICLKSPPRTTIIPLKGFWLPHIFCSDQSTTSTQYLCYIGTSSQIINLVSINNSACWDFLLKPHIKFSRTSSGILNVEWVVRPLNNSSDAIPDEATATTLLLMFLHFVLTVLYKKVCPAHAPHLTRKWPPYE